MARLLLEEIVVPLRSFSVRLSLDVSSTMALVGPSGAGKTTVLRAVAGLVRPQSGRISSGSTVWFDGAAGISLPPDRRAVGLVFQDYALFPHLTVRENVEYSRRHKADEYLDRFAIRAPRARTPRRPLRRGATARRARACPRPRPGGAAARRASLGTRCPHEGRCPHGAAATAVRARHSRPARHARFRGRRGAGRPRRRDRRRRASSNGNARRARRPAERPVRRLVHRREPPPRPRRAGRGRHARPPGRRHRHHDGRDGPRRRCPRGLPVGHHRLDERAERFRDEL